MQTMSKGAAQLALNYPEGHRKRTFYGALAEYEAQRETVPHRVKVGFGARVIRKGDPATLTRMNEHCAPGQVVRFVVERDGDQNPRLIALWRTNGWIEPAPDEELTAPVLDDWHNRDKDWYVPTDQLMERYRKEQLADAREELLEANGTHRIVEMTAQAVAAALAPVLAKAVADAVAAVAAAAPKAK